MNSSLSNDKWAAKRKQLGKGSKLLLNTEISDSYPESFNEGCIDAGTALLAERIRNIWRGPDDPAWAE